MQVCTISDAPRVNGGYGILWDPVQRRKTLAHRLVWEQQRGPIPEGMCVLHSCDNPPCINIEHLFLGTQADNMRDKAAKDRASNQYKNATHCIHGHEFDEENTRIGADGGRYCRTCSKARSRAWREDQ